MTNQHFNIAFNAIYQKAKREGMNTRDHKFMQFIEDIAEVIAQDKARIVALEKILHQRAE